MYCCPLIGNVKHILAPEIGNLRANRRPNLFAGLQGQDCKRCPRVGDVMAAIVIERAREPAARFALISLQPGDPALDRLLGGRDPGLAQDVQHQAGRVAIAGGVLFLWLAVAALPCAEARLQARIDYRGQRRRPPRQTSAHRSDRRSACRKSLPQNCPTLFA